MLVLTAEHDLNVVTPAASLEKEEKFLLHSEHEEQRHKYAKNTTRTSPPGPTQYHHLFCASDWFGLCASALPCFRVAGVTVGAERQTHPKSVGVLCCPGRE